MKKYRKKPVVIEAVRFNGRFEDVAGFMPRDTFEFREYRKEIEIKTLEGVITASAGDYIIKGIKGEFYPCKPDIFEQTYEETY